MAGAVAGKVIVIHASEGRLVLRVERAATGPFLEVTDSAGNSFVIVADDYERASREQAAQFYAAKATAIREDAAKLN